VPDLPFELPPRKKRTRTRRPRRAVRVAPRAPTQLALFQAPDVQRCGFCGATVTILHDVATCPECGGIVSRER
jgi:hypothetical protein